MYRRLEAERRLTLERLRLGVQDKGSSATTNGCKQETEG